MKIPDKQENIAEYLLYMWQTEDLLRACNLDIDQVQRSLIDSAYATEEERATARDWYEGLIMMMKSEGVQQEGHLQINKNLILDLTDTHLRLPKIQRNLSTSRSTIIRCHTSWLAGEGGRKQLPELETCFTALYGYRY